MEFPVRRTVRVLAATAAMALLLGQSMEAQTSGLSAAQAAIERVVRGSGADVGIGIRHLERGTEWFVNGDRPYLMGSTYKIPIAVHLLELVDRGEEDLRRQVALLAGDLFPSGSLLSERFHDAADPGVRLALVRYFELMMILSDNAATDVILRAVGGAPAVTTTMRRLGITGMRVDRTVMEIYRDYVGLQTLPPVEERNLDVLVELMSSQSPRAMADAQRAFHASPRDRSTPRAMIGLLDAIWNRSILSRSSTDLLMSTMRRVETADGRIKGRLPPGTPVASKTGTFGTVVANDVGIVELPDRGGHVAIAVFTEDATSTAEAKERTIAEIARIAYDYFVLGPTG